MKLVDIANQLNLSFKGDSDTCITQFYSKECPLKNSIKYLGNKASYKGLSNSYISAVIISVENAKNYNGNCLIDNNHYLAFSNISRLLSPDQIPAYSIHSTAYVFTKAKLGNNVSIGPQCVIEDNVEIGDNSILDAACIIANDVKIGEGTYFFPKVTVYQHCTIGNNVRIQSGAIIGSEGFGYARQDNPTAGVELHIQERSLLAMMCRLVQTQLLIEAQLTIR